MRTLVQLQPGRERARELGARLQFQLVSLWRLLNPSRQVQNTWAERSETREVGPGAAASGPAPRAPESAPSSGES